MRVLLIEDELRLAESIKRGLEKIGYAVDCLADGQLALRRLSMSASDYDIVILDLIMPYVDGFEVCRAVRERHINVPILVLTALSSEDDKVSALNAGADDYVVKPFSFKELVARLHALLRRPQNVVHDELIVQDLYLDTTTRAVKRGKFEIALTNKEFMLLEYFMRHQNQVLTREQIISHLWGDDFDSFSNIVDVHIKNLRKKIKDTNGRLIQTVQSVGYKLAT